MYEKQIIKRETQFSRAHETPDMIKSGKQYTYTYLLKVKL